MINFIKSLFSASKPEPTAGCVIRRRTYANGAVVFVVSYEGGGGYHHLPRPSYQFTTLEDARGQIAGMTLIHKEIVE